MACSPEALRDLIVKVKFLLRFLGGVVSLMFAAQGIWLLVNPEFKDFWEGCHWLGQGMLGLGVGFIGCFMEVKGGLFKVQDDFRCRKFALNRIGLCIFYFWLGCFVMGGMGVIHSADAWKTTAHVTGILAWIVSVGDLLVSCCFEVRQEEPEEKAGQNPKAADATTYGQGTALQSNPWPPPEEAPERRLTALEPAKANATIDSKEIDVEVGGGSKEPEGGFQWNTL
eukprot:TRINITY_DN51728_c0_g1_i1.p2 TRINITY_DN51728_c0_g1~~TRINITY_DN51728_c0_g1_i1.p2  ORF type:complete len:226 (-),score=43.19 TRINITY_DN51728_c0_g1_i1:83-760(-)